MPSQAVNGIDRIIFNAPPADSVIIVERFGNCLPEPAKQELLKSGTGIYYHYQHHICTYFGRERWPFHIQSSRPDLSYRNQYIFL